MLTHRAWLLQLEVKGQNRQSSSAKDRYSYGRRRRVIRSFVIRFKQPQKSQQKVFFFQPILLVRSEVLSKTVFYRF